MIAEQDEAPYTAIYSRTGKFLTANIETENDGSLVIITRDEKGYRSAHRDCAQRHFKGHVLWRMNAISYVNDNGVRVVLTRWNTQAFRKGRLGFAG